MRSFVTLLLAISLPVTSVAAQTGDWAAVEGFASGTDVSVKTRQGKFQGKVDAADPGRLVLWSQERDFPGRTIVRREIAPAEIKQIRLNHRLASIAAGAAIGAGIGVGVNAAVDSQYSSNEDRGLLGAILGILGTAVGAGMAKSHPFIKGKTIYLAP